MSDQQMPIAHNSPNVVRENHAAFFGAVFTFGLLTWVTGCSRESQENVKTSELAPSPAVDQTQPAIAKRELPGIVRWAKLPPLEHDVAIMESVFWEPADTESLRAKIFETSEIQGSKVLEVGTGSGLISLCCLQAGAATVVATDLNPAAVENVRFNASSLEAFDRLDARLVPRRDARAWTVIRSDERFHFIISNPPWADAKPQSVDQFALYDPNFALLDSLVQGARDRLLPNGRMWLAYGCVTAIKRIQKVAKDEGLTCLQLDDRSLEDLPELFLPGMLLEISVPL